MRRMAIAAFLALLIGCGAGASLQSVTAQSTSPAPAASAQPAAAGEHWEQFCELNDNYQEIDATVRKRGTEGRELVTMVAEKGQLFFCFKRRMP